MEIVKKLYLPFMERCWTMNIPDILIAAVVPLDHSTISKYRKEYKTDTTRTNTTSVHVELMFEILKEFPQHIEHISITRLSSTQKFFERRPEILAKFNECWNEVKETYGIENTEDVAIEREVPITFNEPILVKKNPVFKIKLKLKEAVAIAIECERYDLAHDIIEILEDF